jgi:hypothetical protein
MFIALLRVGLFENALHGLKRVDESEIHRQAKMASGNMLLLLKSGLH